MLTRDFFARPVVAVARDLIGATLLFGADRDAGATDADDDGVLVGGTIIETEAYDRADPASHSFAGPTARTAVMFGPAGRAYVYRSYGIHWCFNVVCGIEPSGQGSAVLIRALAPTVGLGTMRRRRGVAVPALLCGGPGRLCQALGITGAHNGLPLDQMPFRFEARTEDVPIVSGPRIGLTKGIDTPWRFGRAGTRLSRPWRATSPTRRRPHQD